MEWTVQGERTYAHTGGRPFNVELPCVIFMHGAQNDHLAWGLQTHWFAYHGFNILAVGLPGHGRSGGAPLKTVEATADQVVTLMRTADVTQPVIVVDHSMGLLIAFEYVSRYADHIHRIALVATTQPMRVSDALLDAALNNTASAIEMMNTWSHSSSASKSSLPGPGPRTHGGSQRLMGRVVHGTEAPMLHIDSAACNAYARGTEAMASVRCPPPVIIGEKDQMMPAKIERHVAAELADSRVVGLPGGHTIMEECPGDILDALAAFARERDAVATQDASRGRIMATIDSHSLGSFAEFYPYYLSEHQDRTCRYLHFAGSTVALVCLILLVLIGNLWWLPGAAVSGYALVWVGHLGFEKNQPTTLRHPFYGLMGDWVMYRDIWTGRIPL